MEGGNSETACYAVEDSVHKRRLGCQLAVRQTAITDRPLRGRFPNVGNFLKVRLSRHSWAELSSNGSQPRTCPSRAQRTDFALHLDRSVSGRALGASVIIASGLYFRREHAPAATHFRDIAGDTEMVDVLTVFHKGGR